RAPRLRLTMKIALVTNGGVDRSGRESVTPVLLNLIARLARRHQVHVFALSQYPEPCTYPLQGAIVYNLAAPTNGKTSSGEGKGPANGKNGNGRPVRGPAGVLRA